jgi:hypothetical protein
MSLSEMLLAGYITGNPLSTVKPINTGAQTATTITPKLSPVQQKAVDVARNLRMSTAVLSSPLNQKIISAVRARATTNVIAKSGNTIVPTNTLTQQQAQISAAQAQVTAYQAINNLMGKQLTAQTGYIDKLSGAMQVLQQGTVQGSVAQAQATQDVSAYSTLLDKYNQLIQQGTPGTTQIDWNKILLYGGLGIGALVLINAILGRKK